MSVEKGEIFVEALIICDDIRHEVGKKRSLMGVYGGALMLYNLNTPPHLGFALHARIVRNGPIDMEVRMGGDALRQPFSLQQSTTLQGFHIGDYESVLIQIGVLSMQLNPDGWQLETTRKIVATFSQNGSPPEILREFRLKYKTMPAVVGDALDA